MRRPPHSINQGQQHINIPAMYSALQAIYEKPAKKQRFVKLENTGLLIPCQANFVLPVTEIEAKKVAVKNQARIIFSKAYHVFIFVPANKKLSSCFY